MVEWNTDVLLALLANVVANRSDDQVLVQERAMDLSRPVDIPLKEVVEIIHMPEYNASETRTNVELPDCVRNELRDYVQAIASGYLRNAFHNFEHARYVLRVKFLRCQKELSDIFALVASL